jgi:hypothetical protein
MLLLCKERREVADALKALDRRKRALDSELVASASSDLEGFKATASAFKLSFVAQGSDRESTDSKALQALAGAVASELLQLAKDPRKVSARQLIALAEQLQATPTKTSKGRAAHIRAL